MKIRLKIAKCARPTGKILRKLLEEQELEVVEQGAEAVVCYGVGYRGDAFSINSKVAIDKWEELRKLRAAKIKVPKFIEFDFALEDTLPVPFLGRKYDHHGGRDIKVIRSLEGYLKYRRDYYVEIVPSETEFRTWIFRDHHLGTYEKVKVRPAKRKGFGRNYDQGYGFQLVHKADLKPKVIEIAKKAIKALGLDFGAVDILWHPEQYPVVLEVNTAPGVESAERQCIRKLAENINRWLRGHVES